MSGYCEWPDTCYCRCPTCKDRDPSHNHDLCWAKTPEAIAVQSRRAEMHRIVSRWVWIRPIDRLPDRSRKSIPIGDILKDRYGPTYEPYGQDCLIRERSAYEWRRERVKGIPARRRDQIAKDIWHSRVVDRLTELLYRERPLFALIPKAATP